MWYNLSLDGINFRPGYLHKLGVYTESVTVPFLELFLSFLYFKQSYKLPIPLQCIAL
jgi:hypothetical protein